MVSRISSINSISSQNVNLASSRPKTSEICSSVRAKMSGRIVGGYWNTAKTSAVLSDSFIWRGLKEDIWYIHIYFEMLRLQHTWWRLYNLDFLHLSFERHSEVKLVSKKREIESISWYRAEPTKAMCKLNGSWYQAIQKDESSLYLFRMFWNVLSILAVERRGMRSSEVSNHWQRGPTIEADAVPFARASGAKRLTYLDQLNYQVWGRIKQCKMYGNFEGFPL